MPDELHHFISTTRPLVERSLREHLPLSSRRGAERLNDALRDAVFPGGKRFRPLLTLIGATLAGGDLQTATPAACAVEFLHTSSLVLDDLPAMDDADLRRGRPTLHLAYGESLAMLAALALLNQAYALLVRLPSGLPGRAERLIAEAASCVGADGMIGGQAADLDVTLQGRDAITSRNLKTAALMRLTMSAGAIACGADEDDVTALSLYGEGLGIAYQIRDDLLDEMGNAEAIGKTVKQDERHRRASFVKELGVEGAHEMARALAAQGKTAIAARFGERQETGLLAGAISLILCEIESYQKAARGRV